jgi:hypothetical protein
MRGGKSGEYAVTSWLIRHGLDVFLPCVDDKAIDLLVRQVSEDSVKHYDLQVKSSAGFNRILGVKDPAHQPGRYVLILHYRLKNKPDQFYYLTRDQIERHIFPEGGWGDLIFNKPQRERYAHQTLEDLARRIITGDDLEAEEG